ncbi:MAG: peptidoglycan-associated lipoprotein Pal [Acidobacteriota bacterium]|nr:peptidoglycan-associated lipoprotein Pal [Acidobacteriota bacterium]
MFTKRNLTVIGLALTLTIVGAGCKKKVAPPAPPAPVQPPPPPPPPPAAPAITQFTAEPGTIQRGQSSTLRWEVTGNTTSISINQGVGAVQATGSQRVSPSDSTTYTLTATGPGGTRTATTTVSVTAPPPPPPPPPAAHVATIEDRLSADVQDAYYDYDKSDVRSDARDTLTKDAAALKAILSDFPNASIVVEGHCDERGSAEYNLGLGDRRASSAKEFLQQLGVDAARLKTVSYGKERPQCTDKTEECYQKNRRVHFAAGQ